MPQHVFHHQDGLLPAARGTYELDCVTGACLVIRRDVFDQLGGYDEGYRNGLEDVDLCLRARMAGHRVVYRGDIAFVHAEGASRGAGSDLWATPERLAAMRSNDLRFIGAWGAMLDEDVELAAATWDAELHELRPIPASGPAGVVLEGQPGGLAPAGDEARAILAACAAGGPLIAARDEPFPRVAPRLDPSLRAVVREALGREPLPGSPRIVVPAGAHALHALDGVVLRAGVVPAAGGEPAEVWAPAPDVAAAFAAAGLPEHRVHVVAPALQRIALGEGGEGVLAILPAHHAPRLRGDASGPPRRARRSAAADRRLPGALPRRYATSYRTLSCWIPAPTSAASPRSLAAPTSCWPPTPTTSSSGERSSRLRPARRSSRRAVAVRPRPSRAPTTISPPRSRTPIRPPAPSAGPPSWRPPIRRSSPLA